MKEQGFSQKYYNILYTVFKQELISTVAVLGYLFDSVLSPASWHTVQPVNTKTH